VQSLARVLLLTAAVLATCAPAAAAAGADALRCAGDVAQAPRAPVLLVHGTGVTAEENWAWGYAKALGERGHGVCTVDLPKRATVDMQDSVLVTVAAMREVARRGGGRRISLVGHSQGAAQAVLALRAWPELGALVDDVVGLAGAYDRGSDAIAERCAQPCVPPFWQFIPGSRLLTALAARPLPAGPSVTAIGTLFDTVVTPQPEANAVPGGRSVQIQDVCPGRRVGGDLDHIHMAGDNVAYALAVDALDHDGPADPSRISPLACALDLFPGADPVTLAALAPKLAASFRGEGQAEPVDREPVLRCPLVAGCETARAGSVLSVRLARRRVRRGGWFALVVRTDHAVRVRLRFARRARGRTIARGRSRSVAVAPGAHTVRIPARACRRVGGRRRCGALRPRPYVVAIEVRPAASRPWRVLARRGVRVVRRGRATTG
jgi:hypothetical protein